MKREEFYQEMLKKLRRRLEGCIEEPEIMLKRNTDPGKGEMMLCVISGEGSLSPAFDLDLYYEDYLNGSSMEDMLSHMEEVSRAYKKAADQMGPIDMTAYEKVKDSLILRPVSKSNALTVDKERLMLEFEHFNALVLTEYLDVNGYKLLKGVMKKDFEKWGISRERLLNDILENQLRRGVSLYLLEQSNKDMFKSEEGNYWTFPVLPEKLQKQPLILTSKDTYCGAALIINPKVRKKVSEMVGGNYYILPCSVHEVIIMRDMGSAAKTMAYYNLVKQVNTEQVKEEDILCDEVLYYDAASDEIVSALNHIIMVKKKMLSVLLRNLEESSEPCFGD